MRVDLNALFAILIGSFATVAGNFSKDLFANPIYHTAVIYFGSFYHSACPH